MGSIIERPRKDGSKAFTAQIVIKTAGKIVHREAETFDRKQAANAWVVKRERPLRARPRLTTMLLRHARELIGTIGYKLWN